MLGIWNNHFINDKTEKDVKKITSFSLFVIINSLLVFISWNYFGIGIFIYVCFLIDSINKTVNLGFKDYFFNILTFILIYHFGILFWMFNIKFGIIGFIISLIYYTIPFCIFFIFNKYFKKKLFIFIPIYLLFELFLDSVSFSFPWIIIGNSLSNSAFAPQIYEYIGSLGGSFLILTTAYFIVKINNIWYKLLIILFITIFLYSYGYYSTNSNTEDESDEKYKYLFFDPDNYENKNKYFDNNDIIYYLKKKTQHNKYEKIFIPELTLKSISFNNFEKSLLSDYIKDICNNCDSKLYFGSSGVIQKGLLSNIFVYSDGINTKFKVKEKLVPYSEYTPKFLRNILNRNISFDYIENESFKKQNNNELYLICYEVVFSNYISKNIDKSNRIILLTSEKFFNNSYFGMKQYNDLIRLRAIENRKPIIKSSNAGTSFFVDKFGFIIKSCKGELCSFSISKKNVSNSNSSFYSSFIVKYSIYFYFNLLLIFFITIKK
jgi:apolipoprotein N-acyltransferase